MTIICERCLNRVKTVNTLIRYTGEPALEFQCRIGRKPTGEYGNYNLCFKYHPGCI